MHSRLAVATPSSLTRVRIKIPSRNSGGPLLQPLGRPEDRVGARCPPGERRAAADAGRGRVST